MIVNGNPAATADHQSGLRRRLKTETKTMKLEIQFGLETRFDHPVVCTPERGDSGHWQPGFITHAGVDGRPKPIAPDLTMTSKCFAEEASP